MCTCIIMLLVIHNDCCFFLLLLLLLLMFFFVPIYTIVAKKSFDYNTTDNSTVQLHGTLVPFRSTPVP